jgi:hypothetical protein
MMPWSRQSAAKDRDARHSRIGMNFVDPLIDSSILNITPQEAPRKENEDIGSAGCGWL